ncbi:hypothetical protein CDD80_2506 [Ophiocordyceps camponoti-rufipedis]|uniref:Ammonium transporter n=1 Tax=Ophiocordyceps camponoti-rufipedis TaxID=2004952 RepID=A0A2C5Z643_9HYPO|nr:hypothetical protein CDD80_2506 [Ophiocordyceps camponoti-rufipedis]
MSYNHVGPPVAFNGSESGLGGDATTTNLNQWYQSGDQAFILLCSCLVLLMVPGVAFLYSGLARRKSALSMLWVVVMSLSVIVFQWYFWGFSLAFSQSSANAFIGDVSLVGLRGVLARPSPGSPLVPALLYALYQMMFCAVTAAITVGAVAERGRVVPAMVFIFVWATLVYCPLAYWVWNANGWAMRRGVLDYAGGVPVEIGSGVSALAYSWVLGRRNDKLMANFRPHNVSLIGLGTVLLWFGWLGFNAGSSFGANLRAVMACWNSCLTAAFAAMTWCLLDYRLTKKWSMVGWCSGAISGLVAATPASGFIDAWASILMGLVSGVACNFGTQIKHLVSIDDALDIFAEHAIGGIVGLVFNGFFATGRVIGLDGVNTGATGGFVDHNFSLLGWQLAVIVAASAYTFVMAAAIAKAIDIIPGLHLRASDDAELLGMDDNQHGEFSYDYVEVRRDFLAWSPQSDAPAIHGDVFRPQHGIPLHADMARSSEADRTEKSSPASSSQADAGNS